MRTGNLVFLTQTVGVEYLDDAYGRHTEDHIYWLMVRTQVRKDSIAVEKYSTSILSYVMS